MAASTTQNVNTILSKAGALLEQGRADEAMSVINHCGFNSIQLANARGVCLLRTGRVEQALGLFCNLVYPGGAFTIPDDTPAVFQANYVSALLVSGNITVAKALLGRIGEQSHPSVVKVKQALRRWKKSIGLSGRIRILLGGALPKPVLDYPPGDL